MAHDDDTHQGDDPAAEPAPGATAGSSVGDSAADTTQAGSEATTPRVPQAGDSFPWEYRDTEEVEDAANAVEGQPVPLKRQDRTTHCIATITSVSRDLVWCDLVPDPQKHDAHQLARVLRVIGFPRHVHVMMADARKALGLPQS